MYHRVAHVSPDPWGLCVSPSHFEEHLQVLRRQGHPIPLLRIADATRRLPPGALAIAFDDGYADNALNAMPLLERFRVPATVFVTTGWLDEAREFWWDDLERVLLLPGRLPRSLRMVVEGSTYEWDLGDAHTYAIDEAAQHMAWRAWEPPPTAHHRLFLQLHAVLIRARPAAQATAVADLLTWAGAERTGRQTHRPLTTADIRALDASGLVEVGAHTVTHPSLAMLDAREQAGEIQQSKSHLEHILSHPVNGFAYPFGRPSDYTKQTVAQVRASGFRYACSTSPGLVKPASDRMRLPRIQVHDWDGAQLAARLYRWFGW
jgi:peptidoglycan/xylan/chitin deacetylase (PgdA/CDA1 family)